MENITVYWCVDSDQDYPLPDHGLTPKPLFTSVVNERNKNTDPASSYYKCKSAQEIFKNTFILPTTETLHILFSNGKLLQTRDSGKFMPRHPIFSTGPAVDYNSRWLFFSEEDVSIQLTPPYFHKTKASEYATVLSGEFNISKWFRPVIPTFSLWDDSKELILDSKDPIAYINFLTDKKIVLKEFIETDKIKKIMHECVTMKEKFPNLPLSENYNRFVLNKKHKELIKEIKQNLV